MEELIISRWNTAIVNGMSKSAKLLVQDYKITDKVFDYGAGKLRNTKNLIDNGVIKVSITDLPTQLERINTSLEGKNIEYKNFIEIYTLEELEQLKGKFDKVLCSFVINTIENKEERLQLLNNIYYLLKEGGKAYIEVRTDKLEMIKWCKNAERFRDGYLTKRKGFITFNKAYKMREFRAYCRKSLFKDNFETLRGNRSLISILHK